MMATYQDGNVRRATANTVTAMRRSAETRRCGYCNRKGALCSTGATDYCGPVMACRWAREGRCTYDEAAARRRMIQLLTSDNDPGGVLGDSIARHQRRLDELEAAAAEAPAPRDTDPAPPPVVCRWVADCRDRAVALVARLEVDPQPIPEDRYGRSAATVSESLRLEPVCVRHRRTERAAWREASRTPAGRGRRAFVEVPL